MLRTGRFSISCVQNKVIQDEQEDTFNENFQNLNENA